MLLPIGSPFAVSRLHRIAWGIEYDKVFVTKPFGGKDWTVLDFYPEMNLFSYETSTISP